MHPHIKALLRWPVQVSTIRLCHLRSLGQTHPNHQNGQFEPLIIQLFKVGNVLEVLYQVGYPSALRWSIFHCSSPIPQPPNHARQGTKKFVAPACGCRLPMKKCRKPGRKLIQDDPRFLYAPGNHAFVIPRPLSVSTGTTRTNPALPEPHKFSDDLPIVSEHSSTRNVALDAEYPENWVWSPHYSIQTFENSWKIVEKPIAISDDWTATKSSIFARPKSAIQLRTRIKFVRNTRRRESCGSLATWETHDQGAPKSLSFICIAISSVTLWFCWFTNLRLNTGPPAELRSRQSKLTC